MKIFWVLQAITGVLAVAGCRKEAPQADMTDFSWHSGADSVASTGARTAQAQTGMAEAANGAPGPGSGAAAADGNRARSAGCGLTGKPTGDLHLQGKDGAGVARDYQVLVPLSYEPSTPLALTFVYHGGGGSSAEAKALGLQAAPGAAKASIFVFPQGIAFQNYGVGWDDRCNGSDMAFFDDMVASLGASYCIDQDRVYAGGFSWGCDQVTALSCCRGDKVRAIAAASCSDEFTNPADYKTYQPCPVAGRTAIRFTHDRTFDRGYPAPLFATTTTLFRSWNACSATATPISPGPCRTFGCRTPFVDCPYDNLGHSLPTGWGADSWLFFSGLTP